MPRKCYKENGRHRKLQARRGDLAVVSPSEELISAGLILDTKPAKDDDRDEAQTRREISIQRIKTGNIFSGGCYELACVVSSTETLTEAMMTDG